MILSNKIAVFTKHESNNHGTRFTKHGTTSKRTKLQRRSHKLPPPVPKLKGRARVPGSAGGVHQGGHEEPAQGIITRSGGSQARPVNPPRHRAVPGGGGP